MVLSMAVPRVTYALAREESRALANGVLAVFGRLHPRIGSPANAVLLQTGMALVVLDLGAFDRILAFIIFSAVVFLALTVATLFRVAIDRRVRRLVVSVGAHRLPRRQRGAGCHAADAQPGALAARSGVVLAGLPVRWLLRRRTTRHRNCFRPAAIRVPDTPSTWPSTTDTDH